MKHLTSILCLIAILPMGILQAQTFNANASTSYTVWTVKGSVNYTTKGSPETTLVKPGMTLDENGTVNVGEKSSVNLVRNKDIVQVNKKGSFSLNGAAISNMTKKQSAATATFFQQLIASTQSQDNKDILTEKGAGYGDGGSAKSQETGAGYGDGGSAKSQETGAGYGDGGKGKTQETGAGYGDGGKGKTEETGAGYGDGGKGKTQETGAGYGDGGKGKTKETGAGYGDGGSAKTKETGAGYGTNKKEAKKKMKKAIAPLKADPIYKSTNKVQKFLMRAATLENSGLNNLANKFYKKALSKNANDVIAKLMYDSFLER